MSDSFSIMIVEDDDDTRENMEDILSLDGYQIQSVSHCLPAINLLEREAFDAVLIDWRLPDGDGEGLISIIKQEQPDTPVVVVTGVREFDTAVTALRIGAYDFLAKPINPDLLRSVLRRLAERKRHLVEIETAQEKLLQNERLAAIGEMVAGLAHESRNAFQRCHSCLAELSLDLEGRPESLSLVGKIQKALDDVNRLLEEVRAYSAPIILERRETDLACLIEESWQQLLDVRHPSTIPQFSLCSAKPPVTAFLDPNRMRQVMRNLLENAMFACQQPGQIVVEVESDKKVQPEIVRIAVSDNGGGIPVDSRESIFAPFFTTKTKGTGLGLAISRRILDSHGGRLFATESELGGARFVVELPVQKYRTAAK